MPPAKTTTNPPKSESRPSSDDSAHALVIARLIEGGAVDCDVLRSLPPPHWRLLGQVLADSQGADRDGRAAMVAEKLHDFPDDVADEIRSALAVARGQARDDGGDDGKVRPFGLMTTRQLLRSHVAPEWLVTGVLLKGQFCFVGGPEKSLKTSSSIDLAVALASGSKFLGEFEVPTARRVAYFLKEGGSGFLYDKLRRVARSKGLSDSDLDLLPIEWALTTPQIGRQADLDLLADFVRNSGTEVVIVDPLYLSLTATDKGSLNHGNLYDMGPILAGYADACLQAGATPILVHHAKQPAPSAGGRSRPLELADFQFAGVKQVAAQWLLFSHRRPFDPQDCRSYLTFAVGGRDGHAGVWDVDVNEGAMDASFGGQEWDVSVRGKSAANLIDHQPDDMNAVLKALDEMGRKETTSAIKEKLGWDHNRTVATLDRLESQGLITTSSVKKGNGRTYSAWELTPPVKEESRIRSHQESSGVGAFSRCPGDGESHQEFHQEDEQDIEYPAPTPDAPLASPASALFPLQVNPGLPPGAAPNATLPGQRDGNGLLFDVAVPGTGVYDHRRLDLP